MNQKKRDERGMRAAFEASKKSTCIRMSVGAVIMNDNEPDGIQGVGHNGVPFGCVQCASVGCKRIKEEIPSGTRAETCRGLHAEQAALLECLQDSQFTCWQATLYCTHHPCSICAKLIIGAGIKEVVYGVDYPDDLAKELFAEAKVVVRQYEGN